MSIRIAKQPLTGQTAYGTYAVLGSRKDGTPQARVSWVGGSYSGTGYLCLDDPAVVREMIEDLQSVLLHLEGK